MGCIFSLCNEKEKDDTLPEPPSEMNSTGNHSSVRSGFGGTAKSCDINIRFLEVQQLETLDAKIQLAIDETKSIDYAKKMLHEALFEIKSYINHFDYLIGARSLPVKAVYNDEESGGQLSNKVIPFSIEARTLPELCQKLLVDRERESSQYADNAHRNPSGVHSVERPRMISEEPTPEIEAEVKDQVESINKVFNNPKLKKARLFMIEIQKGVYKDSLSFLKEKEMHSPFVEIIVECGSYQKVMHTNPQRDCVNPVWNEFLCFDMGATLDEDFILEQTFFTIGWCYAQTNQSGDNSMGYCCLGEPHRYSFKEIGDQKVRSKKLSFKNYEKKETYAELIFRCQLIYDYKSLIDGIRRELDTRLKAIEMAMNELNNPKQIFVPGMAESLRNNSFVSPQVRNALQSMSLIDNRGLMNKSGHYESEFFVK